MKVLFISLGCDKNLADSETVLYMFYAGVVGASLSEK